MTVSIGAISPTPTDDETAAIVAVVAAVLEGERARAAAIAAASAAHDDSLHLWEVASRRSAQRAGLQRGPWRLSGRLPRRARA